MQSEREKRPARKGLDIALVIGIIALVIAALVLLGGGLLHFDMMGRGFTGPGFGRGFRFSPWAGILMNLFWLLVIVGFGLLILSFFRRGPRTGLGPVGESRALDILKERYAKGEITREQYEEMRRDIMT